LRLQENAARETGDPLLIASALRDFAENQVLQFAGDFREAIERLENALALVANEPDTSVLRLRILKGLAIAHIRQGNYGEGFSISRQGLALGQKIQARIHEEDTLLDCGLAACLAGMYPQALEFSHAALAIAGEIEDRFGEGLLKSNLCMIYRNAGDLPRSLDMGTEAVERLGELGTRRLEGQARNRLGHTLLALERWQAADEMYAAALGVWALLDNPNIFEAKAGRAVSALRLGRAAEALDLVFDVMAFARGDALRQVVEPVLMLLNCETVLKETAHAARAAEVLAQAKDWMDTIASRNDDESFRRAYLDNVPANQRLRERLAGDPVIP